MDRMPCFELGDVGSIPAGPATTGEEMKPKTFENSLNRERVVCDDIRLSRWVDGVEYLAVHRENSPRIFLMRKDALKPVTKQQQSKA
jgi:hypothetical protein